MDMKYQGFSLVPAFIIATAFLAVIAVVSFAGVKTINKHSPDAVAQTETWTPYPMQTYEIPLDIGGGHVLRMYDPNGRSTCFMWKADGGMALPYAPIGCVAGNR